MTGITLADQLEWVSEVIIRFKLSALQTGLDSCREMQRAKNLGVAVVGRFKAGKSSLLNHLACRSVLPVGAVPVTGIITRLGYGELEHGVVRFLSGRLEEIMPDRVGEFVSEQQNPKNIKGVAEVELCSHRFGDLRR